MRHKFIELDYTPEPIIAEDWGWCVMLRREPFMLWVGCGNDRSAFYSNVTPEEKETFVPDGREITWCCVVGTDALIWTSFFWKRLFGRANTKEQAGIVKSQLQMILWNEPRINITSEQAT